MSETITPAADSFTAVWSELLRVLNRLPTAKQREVLDFARFLHEQSAAPQVNQQVPALGVELCTAPASSLLGLTGLIALGGDAVEDTEAIYDYDAGRY